LRADEAKIRERGGSDGDIRRLRAERFGEEAAERLADLDRRRADWNVRVEDFRAERSRILADASLSEQERRTAVARLLAERFDEAERTRIEALDRIAADAAAGD
jgi:lipase chaperone LimK